MDLLNSRKHQERSQAYKDLLQTYITHRTFDTSLLPKLLSENVIFTYSDLLNLCIFIPIDHTIFAKISATKFTKHFIVFGYKFSINNFDDIIYNYVTMNNNWDIDSILGFLRYNALKQNNDNKVFKNNEWVSFVPFVKINCHKFVLNEDFLESLFKFLGSKLLPKVVVVYFEIIFELRFYLRMSLMRFRENVLAFLRHSDPNVRKKALLLVFLDRNEFELSDSQKNVLSEMDNQMFGSLECSKNDFGSNVSVSVAESSSSFKFLESNKKQGNNSRSDIVDSVLESNIVKEESVDTSYDIFKQINSLYDTKVSEIKSSTQNLENTEFTINEQNLREESVKSMESSTHKLNKVSSEVIPISEGNSNSIDERKMSNSIKERKVSSAILTPKQHESITNNHTDLIKYFELKPSDFLLDPTPKTSQYDFPNITQHNYKLKISHLTDILTIKPHLTPDFIEQLYKLINDANLTVKTLSMQLLLLCKSQYLNVNLVSKQFKDRKMRNIVRFVLFYFDIDPLLVSCEHKIGYLEYFRDYIVLKNVLVDSRVVNSFAKDASKEVRDLVVLINQKLEDIKTNKDENVRFDSNTKNIVENNDNTVIGNNEHNPRNISQYEQISRQNKLEHKNSSLKSHILSKNNLNNANLNEITHDNNPYLDLKPFNSDKIITVPNKPENTENYDYLSVTNPNKRLEALQELLKSDINLVPTILNQKEAYFKIHQTYIAHILTKKHTLDHKILITNYYLDKIGETKLKQDIKNLNLFMILGIKLQTMRNFVQKQSQLEGLDVNTCESLILPPFYVSEAHYCINFLHKEYLLKKSGKLFITGIEIFSEIVTEQDLEFLKSLDRKSKQEKDSICDCIKILDLKKEFYQKLVSHNTTKTVETAMTEIVDNRISEPKNPIKTIKNTVKNTVSSVQKKPSHDINNIIANLPLKNIPTLKIPLNLPQNPNKSPLLKRKHENIKIINKLITNRIKTCAHKDITFTKQFIDIFIPQNYTDVINAFETVDKLKISDYIIEYLLNCVEYYQKQDKNHVEYKIVLESIKSSVIKFYEYLVECEYILKEIEAEMMVKMVLKLGLSIKLELVYPKSKLKRIFEREKLNAQFYDLNISFENQESSKFENELLKPSKIYDTSCKRSEEASNTGNNDYTIAKNTPCGTKSDSSCEFTLQKDQSSHFNSIHDSSKQEHKIPSLLHKPPHSSINLDFDTSNIHSPNKKKINRKNTDECKFLSNDINIHRFHHEKSSFTLIDPSSSLANQSSILNDALLQIIDNDPQTSLKAAQKLLEILQTDQNSIVYKVSSVISAVCAQIDDCVSQMAKSKISHEYISDVSFTPKINNSIRENENSQADSNIFKFPQNTELHSKDTSLTSQLLQTLTNCLETIITSQLITPDLPPQPVKNLIQTSLTINNTTLTQTISNKCSKITILQCYMDLLLKNTNVIAKLMYKMQKSIDLNYQESQQLLDIISDFLEKNAHSLDNVVIKIVQMYIAKVLKKYGSGFVMSGLLSRIVEKMMSKKESRVL